MGTSRVNEIYDQDVPGALWTARYFRDREPEEYVVVLRPDGSVHSLHHTLAEDAPGASLTKEQAVARGEDFLRKQKHVDLQQWSLVESKSDKRPHRVDHTLTWQQNRALDLAATEKTSSTSGAHERMELQILGDEVSRYRAYIKIPDDWRRQREELTLPRVMLSMVLPFLVLGGLMVTAVIIFLKNLRSEDAHAIPWRRIGGWGLGGLAGYIIIFAFGNRLASFLNAYQTAIPFKTMLVGIGIRRVTRGVVYFAGIVLLFGMAWFFARRAFGDGPLPGWSGMPPAYYRDALWIGVGGTAALVGVSRLAALAAAHWPTVHRAIESSFGWRF